MSEVENDKIETKTETEMFSFLPRVTTDKKRIAEILAPVYVSSVATGFSELHNDEDARFTALGKAVALKLAVKATEYPFIRILHTYKYQSRTIKEYFRNSQKADCVPAPDPDSAREMYRDVWDDNQFNALKRNEHGEKASTCKVITCPKCQGTGKEYYDDYDTEKEWKQCPNCGGSGKEGVYICKRCDGRGKVLTTVKTKRRRQRTCAWCDGAGSGLSIFDAWGGSACEEKWERILEHEPKLHSQSKLAYDYSCLKTDASKKAAQIKKIRTISIEGGVIDPKKHNLSKLPLRKEDIKRVYDVCYPQQGNHVTAFYRQDKKPDPTKYKWDELEKRTVISEDKYFDEKITITTGIGWVKIDLTNGESFWVNTLARSVYIPLTGACGWNCTPLFRVNVNDTKANKCRMKDYEPCVQEAIKEAKREGVATPKLKTNSSDLKKRKDAAQGCGCLLVIIAAVAFGIWWWIEGFSMAAITDLWKSANKDGSLVTAAMVLGGLVATFAGWKFFKKNDSEESTSSKKRWIFVTLGIFLGFFGAHLAYAKRWVLFLLLWGGLIAGNVMSGDSKAQIDNLEKQEEVKTIEQDEANQSQQNTNDGEVQSSSIGNIGFAVWGLLWIGGTFFIRKDGKGNRM